MTHDQPPRKRTTRHEWWKAIRASNLTPQARLLALTLGTWMNPSGERCYPGQDAIAEACGWRPRYVREVTAELVDAGYLEVERYGGTRKGRRQATHKYVPTIPTETGTSVPTGEGHQPAPPCRQEGGDQSAQIGDQSAQIGSSTGTTVPPNSPDRELPSLESAHEPAPGPQTNSSNGHHQQQQDPLENLDQDQLQDLLDRAHADLTNRVGHLRKPRRDSMAVRQHARTLLAQEHADG